MRHQAIFLFSVYKQMKKENVVTFGVVLLIVVSIVIVILNLKKTNYHVSDSVINQRRFEKLMKIKNKVQKNINLSSDENVKEKIEDLYFPHYLQKRGFYTENFSTKQKNAYLTNVFLSSYLTYPLTMALWLPQNDEQKKIKVAVIGAAVECEEWRLPSWIELCHVTNKSWTIEFIGDSPDLKEDKAFKRLHKRLQLKRTKSKVEDMKDLSSYDAFVAFHPGIGTSYDWKACFEKIMGQGKTVLVTAYDEEDANKDGFAFENLGYSVLYDRNKFASLGEPNDMYNTGMNEWVGILTKYSQQQKLEIESREQTTQ